MKTKSINTGNCQEQEDISMKISPLGNFSTIVDDDSCYFEELAIEEEDGYENSLVNLQAPSVEIAALMSNVVAYISGFVLRSVSKRWKCSNCICELMANEEDWEKVKDDCVLITTRDNGGLIIPSNALLLVCKQTEDCVRRAQAKGIKQMKKNVIIGNVLSKCHDRTYDEMFNCQSSIHAASYPTDLLTEIVSTYLKVRLHHLAKEATLKLCPTTIRSTCTNITQFKGN